MRFLDQIAEHAAQRARYAETVRPPTTAAAALPLTGRPVLGSPRFDVTVEEIWPLLASGAELVLVYEEVHAAPARLVWWLTANRITMAFVPLLLLDHVYATSTSVSTTSAAILRIARCQTSPATRPSAPARFSLGRWAPSSWPCRARCAERTGPRSIRGTGRARTEHCNLPYQHHGGRSSHQRARQEFTRLGHCCRPVRPRRLGDPGVRAGRCARRHHRLGARRRVWDAPNHALPLRVFIERWRTRTGHGPDRTSMYFVGGRGPPRERPDPGRRAGLARAAAHRRGYAARPLIHHAGPHAATEAAAPVLKAQFAPEAARTEDVEQLLDAIAGALAGAHTDQQGKDDKVTAVEIREHGKERGRAAGSVLAAIAAKRDGAELSSDQITSVVADYAAGAIPDYQMSAWLMAVACRGMTMAETVALTQSYVDSGEKVQLPVSTRPIVDKHSSGGVGDKVSLFVAPVVAALGVDVLKMSGRGLDFAGGTLDKLESIPGMRVDLATHEMLDVLDRTGMVITGQTGRLVPADGATYALRDVTGSVHSLPLIAASIMSKKIASGARGVVLDVKSGPGGLVGDLANARELAAIMLEIGAAFGLRTTAVLSDMSQPLGRAVGNALEVTEAVHALRGSEVPGFTDLAVCIAACMLRLADPALTENEAAQQVRNAVADGSALRVFRTWLAAQGGTPAVADNTALLPQAPHRTEILATKAGWIARVDAHALGRLSFALGAGRLVHMQDIDHAVGLVVHRRVGDHVREGELLVEIHSRRPDPEVAAAARAAFTVTDQPCPAVPVVIEVLDG